MPANHPRPYLSATHTTRQSQWVSYMKFGIRCIAMFALWLSVIGLLLIAQDPYSPYWLRLRPVVVPLTLGIALTGLMWLYLLRRREYKWQRAISRKTHVFHSALGCALMAAACLVSYHAIAFQQHRQSVLQANNALDVMTLGRHFIVGYRDFNEVATLAAHGAIAGVYLKSHNVQGRDPMQVQAEIMALQLIRERNGHPPLLVAADQEGGAVQHMSPPLPARASLGSLINDYASAIEHSATQAAMHSPASAGVGTASPSTLDLSFTSAEDSWDMGSPKASADMLLALYEYGLEQGDELRSLGINLNFGPVVDLQPVHASPSKWDRHTKLHLRALSDNPYTVAEAANAYMSGLGHSSIHATLKHFPGLSRVSEDTHHFPATLNTPSTTLQSSDWIAFQHTMPASAATMLSHVVLSDVDPIDPSSLSASTIKMLRQEWGYQGLLITDDLNMGAVYHTYGMCESTRMALNAGVDLVLIAYDSDQFYNAMACSLEALRNGQLQLPQSPATHQRMAKLFGKEAPQPAVPSPPTTATIQMAALPKTVAP